MRAAAECGALFAMSEAEISLLSQRGVQCQPAAQSRVSIYFHSTHCGSIFATCFPRMMQMFHRCYIGEPLNTPVPTHSQNGFLRNLFYRSIPCVTVFSLAGDHPPVPCKICILSPSPRGVALSSTGVLNPIPGTIWSSPSSA